MYFQLEVAEARLKSLHATKDDAECCICWVLAMLWTWLNGNQRCRRQKISWGRNCLNAKISSEIRTSRSVFTTRVVTCSNSKPSIQRTARAFFFSDWREKLENRRCNERMAVVAGAGLRPTRRGWGALYSRERGRIEQQLSIFTCDEVKVSFLGSHGKALLLTLMYRYESQYLVLCRRIHTESSKYGYRDTYLYSSSKPRARTAA